MDTQRNPQALPNQTSTQPASTASTASTLVALYPEAGASSDVGKVRTSNQDQFLVANITSAIQVVHSSVCPSQVYFGPAPAGLFVVADGMGGHNGGREAAAVAVNSLEHVILSAIARIGPSGSLDPIEILGACFKTADTAVADAAENDASLSRMGTTMTAALVAGADVHIAHAGDSRAYLLRNGQLVQLTRDHTVAAELEGAGHITHDEAGKHPMRHVVTNVIGGGKRGVRADICHLDAVVGDRLLLCSDGLTDMVDERAITRILGEGKSANEISRALVLAALDAGGEDNVTALTILFRAG